MENKGLLQPELDDKIRKYCLEGAFTEETYKAVRDYFGEKESEAIGQYWKAHPEEFGA